MRKSLYNIFILFLMVMTLFGCEFKKQMLSVTFKSEFHDDIVVEVKNGLNVEKPIELTKEGYTFQNWYLEDEIYDFSKPVLEDITINAKWEINKYKIKLYDNETLIEELTIEYGTTLDEFDNYTIKEGYAFNGWYINDVILDNDYIVNSDAEIIGKWEESVYEVKFFDEGNLVEKVELKYGEFVENIILEKKGYNFLGWYYLDNKFDFNTKITENIELNAKWEEISFKIDFIYDLNNEEIIDSVTYKYGEEIVFPNISEKKGYEFKGWDTTEKNAYSDLTIKAKYELKYYEIVYKNLDDCINNNPIEYSILDEIILDAPYKKGNKFLGWFTDEAFNEKIEKIELGSIGSLELYAKFEEVNTVKVIYDLNGGEFNENDLSKFDKEVINCGSFNIDQHNVDFWEIYASNVFIYDLNNCPNPIYSLRCGVKQEGETLTVINKYTSGESVSSEVFSDCNYVIVVSEHYTQGYSGLNAILEPGRKISFENFDFDNTEAKEINTIAKVFIEGELTTSGYFNEGDSLLIPTRKGHKFIAWYDENNKKYETVPSNEVSLRARWVREIGPVEDELDLIEDMLYNSFTDIISSDIDLITEVEEVNAKIEWSSSNEDIISSTGKVTKVMGKESTVTLSAVITLQGVTREVSISLKVAMGYKDLSKGGIIGGYNYTGNIPDDATLKNVDILYCAFGEVASNGKISNYSSIVSNTKIYVDKAHAYGTYVLISISTSNLATVAANDNLIDVFVNDLVKLINECKLDGIDMDWETPTAATKTNYTRLMKQVRAKVKANNPAHLVTSALGAGPWQYVKFDLENSHKYLDYINLMSYDMQTNAKSSYQNALYKSSKGYTLTQCSIDQTLPLYNALGVPNEKIIVGVPFYARVFKNTNGLGQASEAAGSATQTFLYENFLSKNVNGVTVGWDDECKVPYIYDGNNKKFYSYENEKSIEIKAQYIHDKGLAGMMYWQRTQDYKNILLNAIYNNKKVMENK